MTGWNGSANCSSCGRVILWCTLEGGRRMPLNLQSIPARETKPGLVAFNRGTGGGRVLRADDLALVPRWQARGATVHESHFATCPAADRHRRPRRGASSP